MFNENRPLSAQQERVPMASVRLPVEAWNVIRAGLWELPAKIAVPLIKELEGQLAAQTGQLASAAQNNLEALPHE